MADLITRARAKYNLNNLATTADEDTTLDALITACSKAIRRYCRREFDSQQFDELCSGNGQPYLQLRQFPVISVARVAYEPTPVLRITNTSATNQRATVAVTSTGLTLVRVASGVVSTDSTITFAGSVTLSAVATAVNALGNGWSASVVDSSFNNRASADLRVVQGAWNAKDVNAELKIHLLELSDYEIDDKRGWLLRPSQSWLGGANYWRVIYTAGFATVPEDVQEACAEWVAALFWQSKRDPGLASERVPFVVSRTPFGRMPNGVRTLLQPYRDSKIM